MVRRFGHSGGTLVLGLLVACFPDRGEPGSFTVTSATDLPDARPGDGRCADTDTGACTLRAAIMESNADPDANTIVLPAGRYDLTRVAFEGTPEGSGGSLLIDGSVRVLGEGASTTIISADGLPRRPVVVWIRSGTVLLADVTIRDGGAVSNSGGGVSIAAGAFVALAGVFVTRNSTTATGSGAGIWDAGTTSLTNTTVEGNTAGGLGGGIFNADGGLLTMAQSTISGNQAGLGGGGVWNHGGLTAQNSTISGNVAWADNGGGGVFSIRSATAGPRDGRATFANATVASNRSGGGFGAGGLTNSGGFMRMSNSIVARNVDASGRDSDCSRAPRTPIESGGYNLIGDALLCALSGDLATNLTGLDPNVSALANHGGLTSTHRPLSGSPAIDAGNPAAPGSGGDACLTTDQRGRTRTGRCDIGAFEVTF